MVRLKKCKAFYFTPNNLMGWHYTVTYDYAAGRKERYTVIARRVHPSHYNFGDQSFVIGIELDLKASRNVIEKHQLDQRFLFAAISKGK